MVRIIDRLPTEKEEMERVRRAVSRAREYCLKKYKESKEPCYEIYHPRNGTWFSVYDFKLKSLFYVFPLKSLIKTEGGDSFLDARSLAEFLERGEEEFTIAKR